MDRALVLFFGTLLTFASAWFGLVFAPFVQLNSMPPAQQEGQDPYPRPLQGEALAGLKVYQANGCIYCHSQQVRAKDFGKDIVRGWGTRRTVPRDYIYEQPVMLGTMRTGPDLSNVGVRIKDAVWHHIHLINPQSTSPGSVMPPFEFLYEKRAVAQPIGKPSPRSRLGFGFFTESDKITGQVPDEALSQALFEARNAKFAGPGEGFVYIPTDDAKALVAYLLAQDRSSYDLEDADK